MVTGREGLPVTRGEGESGPSHLPLVSAIIPTRNRPELLARALQTALAQDYPHIEVIVVDDASSPPAELPSGTHARLLRMDTAGGAGAARNAGVESARGDLVAFLDDDDEWLAPKLREQVEALSAAPDAVGVISGFVAHRDGTLEYVRLPPEERELRKRFLMEPTTGPPMVLLKKEDFVQVGGFDTRLARYEDWDLWLRLTDRGRFKTLPKVHVRVNLHRPSPVDQRMASYKVLYGRIRPRLAALPPRERLQLRGWHARRLLIRYLDIGRHKLKPRPRGASD